MPTHSGFYLGIDTGGTFTDGVLLDPATGKVIQSEKVLTTHYDLRICISEILEKLVKDQSTSISMVSLSTTLATNAIAEGKRKPVALFLLGYDPDLVHHYNFQSQFGTSQYFFVQGKHGLDGLEQNPLDEAALIQAADKVKSNVEAFAVVSYAGSRNAAHEERAARLVASLSSAPIVEAHHLSSEPDSIRRATTASLNASLLANTQEFVNAVQGMLSKREIHCPLMIVRGDGSIAKADYARKRPVEIIHSGPATSAIGGQYLSGVDKALVIDMGGTTTDIAMVEKGKVQVEQNAATVGHYRTCVKTVKVRSIGLGGDSLIRFDRSRILSIGPERVLPFSHFCAEFPQAKQELLLWLNEKQVIPYAEKIEFWVLRREPMRPFKDPRTQKAIDLLRDGPMLLPKLLKLAGAKSPIQVNVGDLVNQEIIERVGLTPTDILHASGEFAPWDASAACQIIEILARNWGMGSEELIQSVRDLITRRIAAEVIQFLSGKTLSEPSVLSHKGDDLDRWLFEESMRPADQHLGCQITLKEPIVGIGAPANAFLPAVASVLGTQIILPEHYAVANAVGTVVGNVMVRQEGDVLPVVEGAAVTGYLASAASQQTRFDSFAEALTFTRKSLTDSAAAEAASAGAQSPHIECVETEIIAGMLVHLSAWGIGKPGREITQQV